jgi:hypothetical protein
MKADGERYMNEGALELILKQLGWDYANNLTDITKLEHNIENDVVPLRADFYPEGWVLARSNKATIRAYGTTTIKYKNYTYKSPWSIVDDWGMDSLDDVENWIIEEEMEWTITKFNGDWVTTFTHLTECPFRTKVKC